MPLRQCYINDMDTVNKTASDRVCKRGYCSHVPEHECIDDGLEEQFLEAWNIALDIAHMLKTDFGARRIRIAGSLLERDRFHKGSDIDLVVENFTMSNVLECDHSLTRWHPWRVDIVPLRSLPVPKRRYFRQRSYLIDQ